MAKLAVRLIKIEAQSKPYSNRKVKKKVGGAYCLKGLLRKLPSTDTN